MHDSLSESEIEQLWTSNAGELVKTYKNKIDRAFDLKMWETVLQQNRCPIRLFQLYTGNRSKIMCQADSPFYLVVHWKHKDTTKWYKAQPMGIHKVNDAMKTLANLAGRKTNHCGDFV